VSVSPRDPYFMPDQLFARITGELAGHRETIEAIFLNNYNEPTVDRRFVDQCRALMGAGFPVAIATNGSGLTPDRVDDIVREGRLRYLGFNLSTVDRGRYRRDRGVDHLDTVLRNIQHAGRHQIADEMAIVVLGLGDEAHRGEFERIQQRFEGSRYQVRRESVMNRAGNIDIGLAVGGPKRRLSGCENIGSRPVQHLHITAHGSCLLCCQDYFEQYPVGDLTPSSIHDVMSGEALSRYRRWVYGAEETPDDFICNRCVSAISAPARHREPDDSQPVDRG